jgi:hypothetical protein
MKNVIRRPVKSSITETAFMEMVLCIEEKILNQFFLQNMMKKIIIKAWHEIKTGFTENKFSQILNYFISF